MPTRRPARSIARPLRLKTAPPQPAGAETIRQDVCEQIFSAGAARLVLLRAPAGFGKTTAMRQVMDRFAQAGVATAWLTLDRADNDVHRFLAALPLALSSVVPGLADADAAGGPDELVLAMLDRLTAHPAPFALFLDDFEALQDEAALGIVIELIDHLPRGAQLIVGSRGLPELKLGRLRARGRLLEIGAESLRFSESEVEDLFRRRLRQRLDGDDIRRLHRSTEGWAAALGLASISLGHHPDPAGFIAGFSGSNSAVVDFLIEDVLARLNDDDREFLVRTSILSELHGSICDAVTGRRDGAERLRRLEAANLFLVPIGGARDQYRYHGMFAECLRDELQRDAPSLVPRVHRAASEWFDAHGRPVPAIEHALAAGDIGPASSMLDRHAWTLLDGGRVRLLSRWLDALREAGALGGFPMLRAVHAWAVLFARGPRAAHPLVEAIDEPGEPTRHAAHMIALRTLILSLTDRIDQAVATGTRATAIVSPSVPFAGPMLRVCMANLALITSRLEDAQRLADEARSHTGAAASDNFNLALSGATEACIDLARGRLRKAIAGLRIAISAGAREPSRPTNGNALIGIPLALALYEAGELDQAERLLGVYIPLIRGVCIPDDLITAHLLMARIQAWRNDPERAEQILAELEHIGHRDHLPRAVATARLERVRMLVTGGQPQSAGLELARCGDRSLWAWIATMSLRANEVETWEVAQARVWLGDRRFSEAAALLERELAVAERNQRSRRALSLRLLLSMALQGAGARRPAFAMLADALAHAGEEGYVQAILDEGPGLLAMVRDFQASSPPSPAAPDAVRTKRFLERVLRASPAAGRPDGGNADDGRPAADTLSRKERQVLRLAAEGHTNDELAERLFVAETTVRTHLRNINVKLDTRSRVEAIAAARKLGLLD